MLEHAVDESLQFGSRQFTDMLEARVARNVGEGRRRYVRKITMERECRLECHARAGVCI